MAEEEPEETAPAEENSDTGTGEAPAARTRSRHHHRKKPLTNRLYRAFSVLCSKGLRLLRLPIDVVWLTWDSLRAVKTIFRGIKTGKRSVCPYCYSVNTKGMVPRPVFVAGKYGNWWLLKLLSPCVRGPNKDLKSPHCSRKDPRKWKTGLVFPVAVIMITGWGLLGFGSYKYSDRVRNLIPERPKDWVKIGRNKDPAPAADRFADHMKSAHALFEAKEYKKARIEFLNAAKLSPTNAVCQLQLGKTMLGTHKYREALGHFLQAEKLDPKLSEAQTHIADLYFAARHYDKTIEYLEKSKGAWEDDVKRRLALAQSHMVRRNPDEAREIIAGTIKLWHDTKPKFEHLLWVGRLLAGMGEQKAAVRLFRTTVEEHPDHLESHIGLVALLISQGQIEEAEAAMAEARKLGENKPELEVQDIELDLLRKGPQHAIERYQKFSARHPNRYVVKARIANLLLQTGREDEAKLLAEEMLEAPERDQRVQGHLIRARIYFDKRLFSDAIMATRQAVLEDENNPAALLLLAQSLFMQGKYKMAVVELKRVRDIAPDLVLASLLLARAHHELGQIDLSRDTYRETVEQFPSSSTALLEMANFHYLEKDFDEAVRYYEKLLAENPNSAAAANNLAQVLADQGAELDRAHQLALDLYERYPRNPVFSDLMGWVLYRQGKYQDALPHLKRGVRDLPRFPAVHYHYAAALIDAGEEEEARFHLENALRLSTVFVGADHAQDLLKKLGQTPVPSPESLPN